MRRAALWLAMLAALVYAPGLGGGFVYDDDWLLVDNPRLADETLARAFSSHFWEFQAPGGKVVYYNYRPLGILAHSALYRLFGLSPFAYHSASILLHVVATLALFFLLTGLELETGVAAAAAALFAVHPLHVEAVAWMSELTEVMAGAGVLGSLALFVRQRRLLGLLVGAAALLCKETALALPFLILLAAAYRGSVRGALRASLPYAALTGIVLAVRLALFPAPASNVSVFTSVSVIAAATMGYARLLFIPWPLATHRALPDAWDMALGAAIVMVLLWLAWRHRGLRLAAGLAAVPLLVPLATAPQLPELMRIQDRYAYVAVGGACLAAALLLARLPRRPATLALLSLLMAGALGTLLQARTWQSSEALWTHTLSITPASKQASLHLGYTLFMEGRFAEAEKVYRRALAHHPGDRELLASLAALRRSR